MTMQQPILELQGLGKSYGAATVLDDIDLTLPIGARHALIGPNGAGKSTLFSLVAGTDRASRGRVRVEGKDVTNLSDVARSRLGVCKTFQHSSLFDSGTVRDNVFLAVAGHLGVGWRAWRSASRHRRAWAAVDDELERGGLTHVRDHEVQHLSHGERRQVEVALALALHPRLLLLDEPTAGMSPAETAAFAEQIATLPQDISIVLVEHDLDVVFGVADTVTVLSAGCVVASGPTEEVRRSEAAQQAYLGAQA